VKRTGKDEQIGVVIHTLFVSIFTSNYQNSMILFYVFSSTKLENRRAEHVLPSGEGVWYQCKGGRWWGKG
jgi:hypothetical protein